MLKKARETLRQMERRTVIFIAAALVCVAAMGAFLSAYFGCYENPYLRGTLIDLSAEWDYRVGDASAPPQRLDSLGSGPKIGAGEVLTLSKTLDTALPEAAILVRTNHQAISVYLDGVPLLVRESAPDENPGMALYFLLLPPDYPGKTLTLEITSPYYQYAGLTGRVYMGSIPTLEAFTLSRSMRSVIMMSMCLLIGLMTIALTLVQAVKGAPRWGQLCIGMFAVVLALYYVCVDYIVFQFFTPLQMSMLSLGLYYLLPLPLLLFFCFSFRHYRKWLLPVVALHGVFVAVAFVLQGFGLVQLPRLLDVNNLFWALLLYAVVLTFLEAARKNRLMIIAAPFMALMYGSILYNFRTFYGRDGVVPYSYRDTYFLLILSVLIFSIQQFFSRYYRRQRETELLQLQNRLARESWAEVKTHLLQVGGLKHELAKHYAAVQAFLDNGRYEQARSYLAQCVGEVTAVTGAVHHENFLLNAVVGKLTQRAGELGVKLELNLKPCPIGVADPDLYSLLNNILENALEACEAVPTDAGRFIRLTLTRQEPYLHITCVNSKSRHVVPAEEGLQSTKPDPAEHGYGLWTVRRIVGRYDGILDMDYDDATFTITAALKDQNKKK